ncbi:histidine phosphatase family protein [Chloroflexota bacterium]
MVKIILVRHGETEWNRLRRVQGSQSNPPLNETGKRQAESLALKMKSESIQAIYSSPLTRSLDTAQAVARHHQIEVIPEPDLKEFDLGELEGISIDDIGKSFDELLITSNQGEALPRVPGGESLREVQQRAWNAIQRLVIQYPDGAIVAVSHYFTILTVVCSALDLSLSQLGRFRLGHSGISTLIFGGKTPRLVLLNDTCHLATE